MYPDEINEIQTLYLASEREQLRDLFSFLRIPSVSSEKRHAGDVRQCAEWLRNYIEKIGFHVEYWEGEGHHPVVFASRISSDPDAPTLLIYNHYDVQPVDPLELWDSPPFEPRLSDGVIYARGAQDNKGQCFYTLQALKIVLERNLSLPLNIKLCIEGEEESGSELLSRLLPEKREALRADYLAVIDVGIKSEAEPTLTLGLRGITTLEVEVTGSAMDLHSGQHGGIAFNPIHALVEMLSGLRDREGKIAVPHFYDQVVVLSDEEKKGLDFSFDEEEYRRMFGAYPTGGERAFSPPERNQLRPTLEINGISGGYTGEGFKTVIPARASAKISCRLVPNQDPESIAQNVARFLTESAPEGVAVEVRCLPGGGPAIRSDTRSLVTHSFLQAIEEVFQKPCGLVLDGASIPVATQLARYSGADIVLLGLGLPDDRIHAPNEKFDTRRLRLGCLTVARGIELLSGKGKEKKHAPD